MPVNVSVASQAGPIDAAHVLILSLVSSTMTNEYHMCAVISPITMFRKLGMEVTRRENVAGQNHEKFYVVTAWMSQRSHPFANTGINQKVRDPLYIILR